ncbi:MAG: SOS response-associated peptidase [Tepidisphaera sp.]|nr:SOS response-associated peptidase [Tepidisphaera sp.]
MCGRYTYMFRWRELVRLLGLVHWPEIELTPRFNVSPTQLAPVARLDSKGQREGVMLSWGLRVAPGAPGATDSTRRINARAETLGRTPAPRWPRRCLVPTSGFYEWRTMPGSKTKQPYWIGREDREPYFFAGVWQPAQPGDAADCFAIVTTTPNPLMGELHDRMPVLVTPDDFSLWLAPEPLSEGDRERLLSPSPMPGFVAYPVDKAASNSRLDTPDLIRPVEPPPAPPSDPQGNLF